MKGKILMDIYSRGRIINNHLKSLETDLSIYSKYKKHLFKKIYYISLRLWESVASGPELNLNVGVTTQGWEHWETGFSGDHPTVYILSSSLK